MPAVDLGNSTPATIASAKGSAQFHNRTVGDTVLARGTEGAPGYRYIVEVAKTAQVTAFEEARTVLINEQRFSSDFGAQMIMLRRTSPNAQSYVCVCVCVYRCRNIYLCVCSNVLCVIQLSAVLHFTPLACFLDLTLFQLPAFPLWQLAATVGEPVRLAL